MDLCRSPPCQLLQEVTLDRPLSDISAAALWHTERSLPSHVAEKRKRLKHYSSKTKPCLINYICEFHPYMKAFVVIGMYQRAPGLPFPPMQKRESVFGQFEFIPRSPTFIF